MQREWWYHRSGCRAWFIAERDTRTNEVLLTALPGEAADRPRGERGVSRLPQQPGERIDRERVVRFTLRRQAGRGARGRHDRLGAVRRRPADVLAQLQVPPPARPDVLRRAVPELPRRGRRRAGRARVHRAGPRGHARRAPQRPARPRVRRDARHRPVRRPVHAARLLLQDVHPPAAAVAAVREGPAPRRRPRRAAPSSRTTASGGPSTAAATPTCWSSAAASRAAPRRRRGRAGRRRGARRRGPSPAGGCSRRPTARPSADRRARAAGVEILERATALGYFDGMVPVWQGDTLHQIRARAPRLRDRRDRAAAGVRRQRPARGDALGRRAPARAALRASRPGTRAVVATTVGPRPRGRAARCTTPASRSPRSPTCGRRRASAAARARGSAGSRCSPGTRSSRRRAARRVARPRDRAARRGGAGARPFDCDLLVVSGGSVPATSLLLQAGREARYDDARGHFALGELPDGVHAAGEVAGYDGCRRDRRLGQARGPRGGARARLRRRRSRGRERSCGSATPAAAGRSRSPPPVARRRRGKCFACLCEDVTAKDIAQRSTRATTRSSSPSATRRSRWARARAGCASFRRSG